MFHHWGARTEKTIDWAEWELPSRRSGRAKRPEVAERSAPVGGVGFEHILKVREGPFPLLLHRQDDASFH